MHVHGRLAYCTWYEIIEFTRENVYGSKYKLTCMTISNI